MPAPTKSSYESKVAVMLRLPVELIERVDARCRELESSTGLHATRVAVITAAVTAAFKPHAKSRKTAQ